ncbi:Hint domain-containing protein, partial [Streptomyces sp. AK02-01A]|uniref:Hint domain-containing protein n=1 Tax=Streptomyces sp. AK02-01A TaxID=3028648 RepID=UPI0029BCFCC3
TAEIKGQGLKHLVKVVIDTDGEKGIATAGVTATDGHPFWVPELAEWIDATDLRPGQWLRTGAGTLVQITAVEHWTAPDETVYNLTVSDLHTYYVLAGTTPILVHNTDGGTCGVVSPALANTADAGEMHGADFASEFRSPSGQMYQAHNAEYVELPEGLKDIIRENDHPAFVCSEMKCLANAYKAEGPAALNGGQMTTVFVSDTEMGEHGALASPCPGCRRVLNSRLIQITGG